MQQGPAPQPGPEQLPMLEQQLQQLQRAYRTATPDQASQLGQQIISVSNQLEQIQRRQAVQVAKQVGQQSNNLAFQTLTNGMR